MLLVVVSVHPDTETGKACCQCRYPECQTFERRISPRLIIGREQCQVQTDDEVIVLHIENAVVAIQV